MRSSDVRATVVAFGLVVLLGGCSATPAPTTPSSPPPAETVRITPSATPEPTPTVRPFSEQADAMRNLPAVDAALDPLILAGGIPSTRAIADALLAAGVPPTALQVTPDRTAIGLAADSVLFSVQSAGTCILGQFDGDGYTSTTAPVLSTGQCLVGATASLD